MSKMTASAAFLILLSLMLLLTGCATSTVVGPTDELTKPCKKESLPPGKVTPRQMGDVLVKQWKATDDCNDQLKAIRKSEISPGIVGSIGNQIIDVHLNHLELDHPDPRVRGPTLAALFVNGVP